MRRTNFVPDIVNCDLPLDNRRSPGFRWIEPFMTGQHILFVGRPARERLLFETHAHTSRRCLSIKGATPIRGGTNGLTPWKDGKANEIKRVIMNRSAWCRRRWWRAGSFSISALQRTAASPRGSGRNPGREPPAGRKAHRLHGDGYSNGGSAIPY
jgi:hypothetical protein